MGKATWWKGLAAAGAVSLAVAALAFEAIRTAPERGALRAFTELIAATNRDDLDAVRAHCSAKYLAGHTIERAEEGGVMGMPRTIHKNFLTWRRGPAIWICPGNRVGLVFQLVPDGGNWKFDGLVGMLRPGNEIIPLDQFPGAVMEANED